MERTTLHGRFQRLNEALQRDKASRKSDPRCVFYEAMLKHCSYETYLVSTHGIRAFTGNRKADHTTGREEILYARRKGWITDAAEF
jgi:hypothetical protein